MMDTDQILRMDGLELLDALDDDSVDLVILDPDYQDWENFCDKNVISKTTRVLKDSGNALAFTKQPFDFHLRNHVRRIFRREIIWSFSNGGAWVSNRMPLVSFQKIYHLTPCAEKSYFNPRTGQGYSPDTKNCQRSEKVFEGYKEKGKFFEKDQEGTWLRDHLHFNKPHTGKIPSKPRQLYGILINCYCPDGGLVVEPFAGSGNFAKVCIAQNKEFLGSEIDDHAIQFAKNNIAAEMAQMKLKLE